MEALQKISDSPLVDCPACQQPALQKLVSAASFRLKGGGWYETDFKTGNKKQLADSGEDSGKGTGSASSKESKAGESKSESGKKDTGKTAESSTAGKTASK